MLQQALNRRQHVRGHLAAVQATFPDMTTMTRQGLRISNKPVGLCSTAALRDDLRRAIISVGRPIKVDTKARDLGIDVISSARTQGVIKVRQLKGSRRARAIRFLGRVSTGSRELAKTGHKPQVAWGAVAMGLAPTISRKLRAQPSVIHAW
eukprot:312787-Pyramimonas_sp.AAC.1